MSDYQGICRWNRCYTTDFRKPEEWSEWRQIPCRSKVHRFRYENKRHFSVPLQSRPGSPSLFSFSSSAPILVYSEQQSRAVPQTATFYSSTSGHVDLYAIVASQTLVARHAETDCIAHCHPPSPSACRRESSAIRCLRHTPSGWSFWLVVLWVAKCQLNQSNILCKSETH